MKCRIVLIILGLLFYLNSLIAVDLFWTSESISISGNFEIEAIKAFQTKEQDAVRLEVDRCVNAPVENFILPVFTETVSLPSSGNFTIESMHYDFDEISLPAKLPLSTINKNKSELLNQDKWLPEEVVYISSPMIMRGERFCQISCLATQYNPAQNKIRLIKNFDTVLNIDYSDSKNPLRSSHDANLFSGFLAKITGSSPERSQGSGHYLFIAPQICESTLQPLLRWKEKLGFQTKLAFMEEIGSTNEDLKSYLQDAYDNWEFSPEFVVLVGDTDGNVSIPAYFMQGGPYSPWNASDHNYSLLDGDDYFPDLFVGRLSVRSISELQTVVVKMINYQKDPYLESDWINSALMMTYIDELRGIFSHRETVLSVRDKLLEFEYTKVDTFINPFQQGQSQIFEFINSGQSFVNFRGCGDMEHWVSMTSYEFMNIEDVYNLSNGRMLPMVTSMACGTGNFADTGSSTCFGEAWLTAGTPSVPKGGIGFIGPSERDTQTEWNNCNNLGLYQGVTNENLFRCGEMLLRGKMELFYNYPLNHEYLINNSDNFYFYVYNLIGDPGLQVWTHTPKSIDLEVNEYCVGMNHIVASISCDDDRNDFIISVTSADSLIITGITNSEGEVMIPLSLPMGNYQVTASKYGFIPQTLDFEVQNSSYLGIHNVQFTENLSSGSIRNIDFDIHNFAPTLANNVEIELISQDEQITIVEPLLFVNSIPAACNLACSFQMEIGEKWDNRKICDILVQINSNFGENIALIPFELISPEMMLAEFAVQNSSGCLLQNETNNVVINLLNCGSLDSDNFNTRLICLNEKVEIMQNGSGYNAINVGSTGICLSNFSLIPQNVMSGETAQFALEISSNLEILQSLYFEIPIGIIDQSSITCCDFGYYAIESEDIGNFETPQYNWIEIDPNLGGSGLPVNYNHTISDGSIGTMDLPFSFGYFGKYYNEVSICTEGYLCLGSTDRIFYRNRNIPAGIGSAAMVAPFWDSLQDGEVYTYFDNENNRFIIEWSDWKSSYEPSYNNTFEVVLYDPDFRPNSNGIGEVLFQYKEVHNIDAAGNYATIGIENEAQTEGLLMTFANIDNSTAHPISSESAIFFSSDEAMNIPFITCSTYEIQVSVSEDSNQTHELILTNTATDAADVEYSVSFTHFSRNNDRSFDDPNRSLENDNIIQLSGNYIPVFPRNILFYLIHNSPDGEPIQGLSIDFPAGFYVNSATDANDLQYNGETGDGAVASWGFSSGLTISPDSPVSINVNITIDGGMNEPVDFEWYIEGDGSGLEPHSKSGTITMLPSDEEYLWITYPNGGETVLPGIQDTICWQHYGIAELVKIELTREDNTSWEVLADQTSNTGFFVYNFPGPLSADCRIKVSTLDEGSFGISETTFQISALNIIYPTGSTVMSHNSIDSLCWNDIGGIEEVNIDISHDSGATWMNLAENIENIGVFQFKVSGPPTQYALFKISSSQYDVENYSQQFSIVDCPVEWLNTNSISGIISQGEEETIVLNFSTTNLEFGIYQAFIRIETEIGQVMLIPTTMEYTETPPVSNNLRLYQNHPNPFNPFTRIDFELPEDCAVELKIFNSRGQFVKKIADSSYSSGSHFAVWNGTDKYEQKVGSGLYLYKLKAGNKSKIMKMILIK